MKINNRKREYILEGFIKDNNWTIGAELGVWKGRTYKHLLKSCSNLTLIGVDLYKQQPKNKGPEQWITNKKGQKHKWEHEKYYKDIISFASKIGNRAIFIRDWTYKACRIIADKSLDFVFIDADHS